MKTTARDVIVKKSGPGTGLGLFAVRNFDVGEHVAEYTGRRIPTRYADTLATRYLFEVDDEWTIDGSARDNIARYINHACEPNCEAELKKGRILIRAARGIARGAELTLDYGDEYFDEFIRPIGCKCTRCFNT